MLNACFPIPDGDSAQPVTFVTRSARIDLLFTMSDITRAGLTPRRADLCSRERDQGPASKPVPSGGARRDRTDDLLLAKQALSQLSYGPLPVEH